MASIPKYMRAVAGVGLITLGLAIYSIWQMDQKLSLPSFLQANAPAFPDIKSKHSLVAKHVTQDKWKKLGGIKTKTSGFTLSKVLSRRVTLQRHNASHCTYCTQSGLARRQALLLEKPVPCQ